MKTLSLLNAVLLTGGLAVGANAAANPKIGYVDMQKAVQSTANGKKARAELEAEFGKKQKDIQKKEADIKKLQEELEKKRLAMTEDALRKKEGELAQEMNAYRQFVGESQANIQKRERELMEPIMKKMERVIDKIAKDGEYTVILERAQGVLWARKDADITDEVISTFDKEKDSKEKSGK